MGDFHMGVIRRCFHEVTVVKKNCIHFAWLFSSLPSLRWKQGRIVLKGVIAHINNFGPYSCKRLGVIWYVHLPRAPHTLEWTRAYRHGTNLLIGFKLALVSRRQIKLFVPSMERWFNFLHFGVRCCSQSGMVGLGGGGVEPSPTHLKKYVKEK